MKNSSCLKTKLAFLSLFIGVCLPTSYARASYCSSKKIVSIKCKTMDAKSKFEFMHFAWIHKSGKPCGVNGSGLPDHQRLHAQLTLFDSTTTDKVSGAFTMKRSDASFMPDPLPLIILPFPIGNGVMKNSLFGFDESGNIKSEFPVESVELSPFPTNETRWLRLTLNKNKNVEFFCEPWIVLSDNVDGALLIY